MQKLLENKDGLAVIPDIHGEGGLFAAAVSSALAQNHAVLCLGDYIDGGDGCVEVMEIVTALVREEKGICLPGNHDARLVRFMRGEQVFTEASEFKDTLRQIADHPRGQRIRHDFVQTIGRAPLWIFAGRFFFAHAGFHKSMLDIPAPALSIASRSSRTTRMALYGEEKSPQEGSSWKKDIPAGLTVCIGHDTVAQPHVIENEKGGRLCLTDTGAGKGGHLSMLLVTADALAGSGAFRIETFGKNLSGKGNQTCQKIAETA